MEDEGCLPKKPTIWLERWNLLSAKLPPPETGEEPGIKLITNNQCMKPPLKKEKL